ncbi:hypothetical protein E4U40_000117 [Claviceps sp. LM458 group G5]|nr:hypothetical protein E4U40_000117 [Claviceps sp. LM458 group G5]
MLVRPTAHHTKRVNLIDRGSLDFQALRDTKVIGGFGSKHDGNSCRAAGLMNATGFKNKKSRTTGNASAKVGTAAKWVSREVLGPGTKTWDIGSRIAI